MREAHSNFVGFKEFGGAADLTCAAEHITSGDEGLTLMVGVDAAVVHGCVNRGATGTITGIGNVLPKEVLHLVGLCAAVAKGDPDARRKAQVPEEALHVLSSFDEGLDLVPYCKHPIVLNGDWECALQINPADVLSDVRRAFAEEQCRLFRAWHSEWAK